MKMRCVWILLLFILGLCLCIEHDFKGFDDTILFGINWPGQEETLQDLVEGVNNVNSKDVLKLTSSNDEKYNCHIPDISVKEASKIEDYEGPSPLELLKPLFSQKICSYRLESYWSYEVCHGRYVRQYHEDREGKQVKVQEYLLGQLDSIKQLLPDESIVSKKEFKGPLKTTKVEGIEVPYVEIEMGEGTTCDLSGKPRIARIKYVCYSHGKHEVYSFKETATCEYEVIILSTLLCDHPLFKPKEVSENIIDCLPIGGSPKKPNKLLKMEVESLKLQHQTSRMISNDRELKDVVAVFKVEKIEKDGETHLKLELQPLTDDNDFSQNTIRPTTMIDRPKSINDDSPVRAFLNGDDCLSGGTGWWKYEFCYGKHVVQYHVDRTGEKTTLTLGKFDEQAHVEWIRENKNKVPKPIDQRTSISHFYSGGDVCDKTGKPRQTEVKLKCLDNSSSPAQVSLYLLEPRTCHYILGVESPLICEILPLADENGLVNTPHPLLAKFEAAEEPFDDEAFVKKGDAQFGND